MKSFFFGDFYHHYNYNNIIIVIVIVFFLKKKFKICFKIPLNASFIFRVNVNATNICVSAAIVQIFVKYIAMFVFEFYI